MLELEVVYLEQYLLSLYRKAFDQQISTVSPTKEERSRSPLATPRKVRPVEVSGSDTTSKIEKPTFPSLNDQLKEQNVFAEQDNLLDSAVHRCHSTLSQYSAFPIQTSPAEESVDKAIRACHSQPLSMMEVN